MRVTRKELIMWIASSILLDSWLCFPLRHVENIWALLSSVTLLNHYIWSFGADFHIRADDGQSLWCMHLGLLICVMPIAKGSTLTISMFLSISNVVHCQDWVLALKSPTRKTSPQWEEYRIMLCDKGSYGEGSCGTPSSRRSPHQDHSHLPLPHRCLLLGIWSGMAYQYLVTPHDNEVYYMNP